MHFSEVEASVYPCLAEKRVKLGIYLVKYISVYRGHVDLKFLQPER